MNIETIIIDLKTEAVLAMSAWFKAERHNLGSFHQRMNLCNYAEWTAARALGETDTEFEGVPRLLLYSETLQRPNEEDARALMASVLAAEVQK